jgi:hypothetical protein
LSVLAVHVHPATAVGASATLCKESVMEIFEMGRVSQETKGTKSRQSEGFNNKLID